MSFFKKINKPIILIMVLFLTLLSFSSCSSKEKNENEEENPYVNQTVSLNGTQTYLLSQCIAIIPPFENIKKVDNEFWHDFIYNFYTHKTINEGTTITDKDDKTWLVIAKEDIDIVTQFFFGINLPNYLPFEKNLYYNDGFYFIQLSDPDGDTEIIANYEFTRCDQNEATFKNKENSSYVMFTLVKADNENGFIIKSLASTKTSPAINKVEETTKRKTEDSSFLFEGLTYIEPTINH